MFYFRNINISKPVERKKIAAFLQTFNLSYEEEIDYCIATYQEDTIVATASLSGRVIRNIAISPAMQGEGIMDQLLSKIISYGSSQGLFYFQLFTKPTNINFFTSSGFRLIATASPYAALLEIGIGGIADFCADIAVALDTVAPEPRAAIVMNCNPFTLGHRYLVEQASRENVSVILFVVEENKSAIPFSTRLQLVREGVDDLKNVFVFSSGAYIISNATFPTYFLKGTDALYAQTQLDATIFAEQIAPKLHITTRYIGEEPFDYTTQIYNKALESILPVHNVGVKVIPRLTTDSQVISASTVRQALVADNWEHVKKFVPLTTLNYLQSEEGLQLIEHWKTCISSNKELI